ncbi:ankyrin repeat-containing domain protein [Xylogone sp. PMI_703]|nr:ankyrin repeat-containing domain protein [Xylogone sp. PMI_703]
MAQATRVTLDWDKHKDEILDLFISQNKTLSEVSAHMVEKHNFHATERQYKSRFPNLKNVKAEEWIWIHQEEQRRAALGKESEVCLHGRPLSSERVIRETARHKNKAPPVLHFNPPNPFPRITVRTPPPSVTAIASRPSLDPLDDLMGNSMELYGTQAHVDVVPTQQSPLYMDFISEQGAELDTDMELIESRIEDNPFRLDLSSELESGGYGDFNSPMIDCLFPVNTTQQSFSFSDSNPVALQSPRRNPFFFSQYIDLELLTTHHNFQLMINLPWFRLQSMLEQPEIHHMLDGVLSPMSATTSLLREGVLSSLLGLKSGLQLTESIAQVTAKLQRSIPERYEGELSGKLNQLLDARSTCPSSLFSLFQLAAYFASNNTLGNNRTDIFLKWVINQKYTVYLEQFLRISTPTIHAFTVQLLKSAVRIKNVKILTLLLDYGVNFDIAWDELVWIDDMDITELIIRRVDSINLEAETTIRLFHRVIMKNRFELARIFIQKGMSVNVLLRERTPLYEATSKRNVRAVRFLLGLGASVNMGLWRIKPDTVLGLAVQLKDLEMVSLFVEHGADTSCLILGKNLLEWSSLNCRGIYAFLRGKMSPNAVYVTVGDLVDAANRGESSLQAYLGKHEGEISNHQLEEALGESIRLSLPAAMVTLLRYGVSPDCGTLDTQSLDIALDLQQKCRQFCEILIKFKVDVNAPRILARVVRKNDFELLQLFIKSGIDLEKQGMEALVESAEVNNITAAALLLDSGVDINTPGLESNPLQIAAAEGYIEMAEFLLKRGADINAPAYPDGGRTALQSALGGAVPAEISNLLLDQGADVLAPPALVDGVTALEAICNRSYSEDEASLVNRLLDAGAPVNRPNGEPSAALHGAIEKGWDEIVARMLEPDRHAIINYMWYDKEEEEDDYYFWEPRTPTQLAAGLRRLNALRMLFDRGADVNESPAYRFGRTALQAATSSENPDMELVQFLLAKGANIHAEPAVYGGITALQGAAISGDIMLAKLLLDRGADVNAAPSAYQGRYAIEGAAEHGRLDMVQLLLNAGAKGNVFRGTGFKYAIKLAEENGYPAVVNLLKGN